MSFCFFLFSFIHLSLHESNAKVLGMPSPEMKSEFTLCCQIINSVDSVGMEGTRVYGWPWKVDNKRPSSTTPPPSTTKKEI